MTTHLQHSVSLAPASVRPLERADWLWCAAVGLGTLLSGLICLPIPFGRDQANAAVLAQVLRDGGVLYRDAWLANLPGHVLMYAAAFGLFGDSMAAVNGFDALYRCATAVVCFLLGRLVRGRPVGVAAAAFYGLSSLLLWSQYWFIAQKETFMILPMVLALYFALLWRRQQRRRFLLLAGFFAGAACYFKPTAALFCLFVIAVPVAGAATRSRPMARLLNAAVVAAGIGASLLPFVAYLIVLDAARPAFEALFLFNQMYTSLGRQAGAAPPRFLISCLEATVRAALVYHIWSFLTALGIVTILLRLPRLRGRTAHVSARLTHSGPRPQARLARFDAAAMLLWLVATVGMVWMQGKFIPYHWIIVLGPASILAGSGITWLVGLCQRRRYLACFAVCALLTLWVLRPIPFQRWCRPETFDRVEWIVPVVGYHLGFVPEEDLLPQFARSDIDFRTSAKTADVVRLLASADDTVLVWGMDSVIYFLSGRRPASRFISDFPLTLALPADASEHLRAYQHKLQSQFLDDIGLSQPQCVVVATADVSRLTPKGGLSRLERLPGFAAKLEEGYRLHCQIGQYLVYERRGDVSS